MCMMCTNSGGGDIRRWGCGLSGHPRLGKRAILRPYGLCVTNTQAADIQQLYSELLDYDKKLIPFSPARWSQQEEGLLDEWKFPQSHWEVHAGKPSTTSRWKLILSEYNSVRARLPKSQALLESINFILYARWLWLGGTRTSSARRDEIGLLMQDLPPPQKQFTTDLHPAKSLQSGPGSSPLNSHSFHQA
jgi:hypothetical protein